MLNKAISKGNPQSMQQKYPARQMRRVLSESSAARKNAGTATISWYNVPSGVREHCRRLYVAWRGRIEVPGRRAAAN
jgi:hypothetical protein